MDYKKIFKKLLIEIWVVTVIIMSFNYIIDPFQQFRINKYGHGQQRKVNPGIAKNYKFDAIIIGTSTSQNIHKKDIKKNFSDIENAVNLSMSGSTQAEQEQLLRLALKYNKVKLIVYGMDMFSYTWNPGTFRSRIPDYLYSENKFLKLKYLISAETTSKSLSSLRRVLKGKQDETWIDNYNYHPDTTEYKKENVYKSAQSDAKNIKNTVYNLEIMKKNFENFIQFIEENPTIEYKIYFVPYTMLWWYYADEYGQLESILNFKKYVVEKLEIYQNVEIYEYQNDENIVSDDTFKDLLHISPLKSKEIVEKIFKKIGKVNYDIEEKELQLFKEKLKKEKIKYKEIGM